LWIFFVLCCFVLFCFVFIFFLHWWDNDRTISETPSPGLEDVGLTPKLLRLKLYYIWTWRLFFHLFFFQSSLCLSKAFSAYGWLLHYLSLFIPLKIFCLFLWVFFYLFDYLFFPFSLLSLLSTSSHPSIQNITIVIITSRKILNWNGN
jgi:hypothetical protein